MTVDQSLPPRLAIAPGQVIVEIGRRWDCDEGLREEVLEAPARVLADEDYEGIADVVLLWWRAGDGDLFDALTDALIACAGLGTIWLLTPDPDQDGHVEASDIADAAAIARLSVTASFSAAPGWDATRLIPRGHRQQASPGGREELSPGQARPAASPPPPGESGPGQCRTD